MAVRVDGQIVRLEGDCGVEDAEALVTALAAASDRRVDLSPCRQLHGAVVQALLVFRPQILGRPADEFLNRFIVPALTQPTSRGPQILQNVEGRG